MSARPNYYDWYEHQEIRNFFIENRWTNCNYDEKLNWFRYITSGTIVKIIIQHHSGDNGCAINCTKQLSDREFTSGRMIVIDGLNDFIHQFAPKRKFEI